MVMGRHDDPMINLERKEADIFLQYIIEMLIILFIAKYYFLGVTPVIHMIG